ncbi:MAG TPA: hypothetical protein VJ385_10640 [Fibrobacteria bacterium]|nr:hypothetical protein [Fibrobacteria bacterium]
MPLPFSLQDLNFREKAKIEKTETSKHVYSGKTHGPAWKLPKRFFHIGSANITTKNGDLEFSRKDSFPGAGAYFG